MDRGIVLWLNDAIAIIRPYKSNIYATRLNGAGGCALPNLAANAVCSSPNLR
jgi:hypothetical protein